jgi:multidrug efflux pump subunit AcrA (membrane-fusion protein)
MGRSSLSVRSILAQNFRAAKSRLVNQGDLVKQGQVVAYMDNSNLLGQLTQNQGQLASAQANLQNYLMAIDLKKLLKQKHS